MTPRFTLHGQVLDPLGLALQRDHTGRNKVWATRPEELRPWQKRSRVNVEHGARTVGRLLDLERCASGLWATCEIEGAPPILFGSWPVYFSAETTARRDGPDHCDVELTGLGLVRRSATVGLSPVTIFTGGLERRSGWVVTPHVKARLERAAGQRYGTGDLMVTDPKFERGRDGVTGADGRPPGPIWHSAPYSGIIAVR